MTSNQAIKIKKISDDYFVVEWSFPNGWTGAETCNSEVEARAFVAGFRKGFVAVKAIISNGMEFDARVEGV